MLVYDQSILPLVINLVILITFTLDDLLMLLGENWCWPLLRPKGLFILKENASELQLNTAVHTSDPLCVAL